MKKIALAMEKFSRYAGGAESYAVSLATSLIENGWEVHLFGETWDGEPSGAIFHKITIPKHLPSWAKMLMFAFRHRKMVTLYQFDVVLGFGNTIYMNVYQTHGGVHRLSTKRKVYSEKSKIKRAIKRLIIILSLKQWVRAWIESAPFRLDPRPRIVAISQMIKTDMESFFRVKGTEIEVVYNGVDTSRYNRNLYHELRGPLRKQLGIKEDDVVFLFISYDLKKKGIESLVEAASKLKISGKNNFKIIVIGGLPYGSLSRQIKNLNLEDMIIFTGQIRSTEEYYANSDVFVLPTYYDACSLVVIEAMACGLPSITTTANGASGIITDGENGYIITHPPDPADLADKMNLLMAYENRKKMSKEAFRIGQDYSTKRNHHDMIRIFNEVITSKK